MAVKFDVSRADLSIEAGFSQPEFGLFRDTHALLDQLYKALEPYGIRLNDIRIEQGGGSAADFHLLCHLFDFMMTIRVRINRVEIYCSQLPRDYVERFGGAVVHALGALRAHQSTLQYRTHALAVSLHGVLEGVTAKDYVSRFATSIPAGLGPSVGSATVMYFGPEGDRTFSSLTVDMSALVTNGLYVRAHVVWDGKQVDIAALPKLSEGFIRHALDQVGLQLPQ
jgi:hypothetical protein